MTHLKTYTSLEQSKELAKILPLKSADMRFCYSHTLDGRITGHYPMIGREPSMGTTPCWSLAALLRVLPEPNLLEKDGWHLFCSDTDHFSSSSGYNNPVDACYEMIRSLHEQNLI